MLPRIAAAFLAVALTASQALPQELRRAEVTRTIRSVKVKTPRAVKTAKAGTRFVPGDWLGTGYRSLVEFRFDDGTVARMGQLSVFRFLPRQRRMVLHGGTALLLIPPGATTKVRTPNAVAGIKGSGLFVRYVQETRTTVVGTLTNSGIEVTALDGATVSVDAGMLVIVSDAGIESVSDFDLETFYSTSTMGAGILDGSFGPESVLAEVEEGLASQGDFDALGEIVTDSLDIEVYPGPALGIPVEPPPDEGSPTDDDNKTPAEKGEEPRGNNGVGTGSREQPKGKQ